jgi:hypothetical protein
MWPVVETLADDLPQGSLIASDPVVIIAKDLSTNDGC